MWLKSLAGLAGLSASLLAATAQAALVVSKDATQNVSCSAGVCTATAQNAVLNVHDLAANLQRHDTSVVSGSSAMDIVFLAAAYWTSPHRLTIDACRSIRFRRPLISQGNGGVALTYNDGCTGGDLSFSPKGNIAFWDTSSSLTINGQAYTLVNDIATLAADISANPSGSFALAKDYDASADGSHETGVVMTPFTGTFEGLGHSISQLAITVYEDPAAGLFLEIDGTARDVHLVNSSIYCQPPEFEVPGTIGLVAGSNAGALKNISVSGAVGCGYGYEVAGVVGTNGGQLANVTSSVNVSGSHVHYAGGVAGTNSGTISKALASGSVSAPSNAVGGLAGMSTGLIQDSRATGSVDGGDSYFAGGLVGQAQGTILRCFATGKVSVERRAGGLVGSAASLTIDSSFATGTASSDQQAGGLVGYASGVTLINSYARGTATATNATVGYAGGLIGEVNGSGSVTASYSTGAPSGARFTGGSVGYINGSVSMAQTYWDLDSSGVSNPSNGVGNSAEYPGLTGLTKAQFKSGLPAGFDPTIWGERAGINNGLPYLLALPPP